MDREEYTNTERAAGLGMALVVRRELLGKAESAVRAL
jgi:hypothetical protein